MVICIENLLTISDIRVILNEIAIKMIIMMFCLFCGICVILCVFYCFCTIVLSVFLLCCVVCRFILANKPIVKGFRRCSWCVASAVGRRSSSTSFKSSVAAVIAVRPTRNPIGRDDPASPQHRQHFLLADRTSKKAACVAVSSSSCGYDRRRRRTTVRRSATPLHHRQAGGSR